MYRVLIVDDEIWSLIGLKKILLEDPQRFELVYETTDPVDALEKICKLRPDVVFTDVRMPEMSGIELIRQVKSRDIQSEFVVISGYAEFTYIQQAMQEGAVDYQLKPFDRNSVQQMLNKVYDKLESKKASSDLEFYALLRDKRNHVAQLLKSRFGSVLYKNLQVVLVYSSSSSQSHIMLDAGANANSLCLKIGPRKWLYLINSDDDRTDALYLGLHKHRREIERAALSSVGASMDSFTQLLNEAETATMDSFVYSDEIIFKYRKPNRKMVNQIVEQMSALRSERKFAQVAAFVDSWQRIFTDNHMGVEDALNLWNKVAYNSTKWGTDPVEILEYLDLYDMTDRFSSLQEMVTFLNTKYAYKIVENSGTANDKFFELLRYIDENYNQHLSLKELCGMFYVNMSYCCELFQKHKNMTFSQYLTEVRINKACELLKYRCNTVAEACEMVGYKDYFYFNKVFKKKMGCTPAEYRKKCSDGGLMV